MTYTASKGERNRVTITATKRGLALTDPGAKRLQVRGPDCRVRRRRAACDVEPLMILSLKDGNDRAVLPKLAAPRPGPAIGPRRFESDEFRLDYGQREAGAEVHGGDGDDVLIGTDAVDAIDGGAGRDRVDGRGGDDLLFTKLDGRRDLLHGGSGLDTLVYVGAKPIVIDVARDVYGSVAERDHADGVERFVGGDGPDRISGGPAGEGLFGGGGADVLSGNGGDDLLVGDQSEGEPRSSGVDVLDGGPGNDLLDARDPRATPTNRVRCGDGDDAVASEVDDLLDADCERAAWIGSFEGGGTQVDWDTTISIHPLGAPVQGRVELAATCGSVFGCGWRAEIVAPPSPESLGSGSLRLQGKGNLTLPVLLTAAGERALAERRLVTVAVGDPSAPAGGGGADWPLVGWQGVLTP